MENDNVINAGRFGGFAKVSPELLKTEKILERQAYARELVFAGASVEDAFAKTVEKYGCGTSLKKLRKLRAQLDRRIERAGRRPNAQLRRDDSTLRERRVRASELLKSGRKNKEVRATLQAEFVVGLGDVTLVELRRSLTKPVEPDFQKTKSPARGDLASTFRAILEVTSGMAAGERGEILGAVARAVASGGAP